jgi:hypothetical protein
MRIALGKKEGFLERQAEDVSGFRAGPGRQGGCDGTALSKRQPSLGFAVWPDGCGVAVPRKQGRTETCVEPIVRGSGEA